MTPRKTPQPSDYPGDARPLDTSVEAVLQREILQLGEWLDSQGLNLGADYAHEDEGSRDRLYWRFGYFVGLKRALGMLVSRDATLH